MCALNCRLLCTFNYSFDGNNTTFVLKTGNKIETAAQLLAEREGKEKRERDGLPKELKLSEMQYALSESVVVCLWVFKSVCVCVLRLNFRSKC